MRYVLHCRQQAIIAEMGLKATMVCVVVVIVDLVGMVLVVVIGG